MSEKYQVIISGRTLDGAPLSSLKGEVAKAFRLGDEQLARMLSGKPLVVSRSTSAEGAERLLARLRSLGLEARAELLAASPSEVPPAPRQDIGDPPPPDSQELFALVGSAADGATAGPECADAPPVEVVSCPKCGESQPKRTLCRACGLDMPRYRAIQEAEEREQREARAAELAARLPPSGKAPRAGGSGGAALIGLGFSGRFGRLDYLSVSVLSSLLWFAFVWLAVATGVNGFAGLGMLLSSIYALRGIALRLHDTGRTGWLALIAVVPVIGALMALALLLIGGEEESNEYGPARSDAGGGRAALALVALLAVSGLAYRSLQQNPEKMLRFAEAMSFRQGHSTLPDDADTEAFAAEPVHYAPNNRIDIYVVAGCDDCDAMLAWLDANDLRPAVYRVDSDQQAAERLHSIIGGSGRIQLPVLEVNGNVMSPNPDVGEVHDQLRLASP